MNPKSAFVYIDDDSRIIAAFSDNVRRRWNLNVDVLSNTTHGPMGPDRYDDFEQEVLRIVGDNAERVECIFLDIDFGSAEAAPDMTGLLLGRALRRRWPSLPIIIATRFVEAEIYKKGMIFDFDNLFDPMELLQMDVNRFMGMLNLTKEKRSNFLASIGDTPVSYRLGRHRYFKDVHLDTVGRFAFVAMPFDPAVVRRDVWEIAIKDGCMSSGIHAVRVDEDLRSLSVMDRVAKLIFNASLVVADLTGWNANVLYELGISHTSNKPCIVISQRRADLQVPFDVRHIQYIVYSDTDLVKLRNDIEEAILQWTQSDGAAAG